MFIDGTALVRDHDGTSEVNVPKHFAWVAGILGSILYSSLCGFLGYSLNSYWSRDRIAIQEVDLFAERKPVNIGYSTYQDMTDCSEPLFALRPRGVSFYEIGNWLDREGNLRAGIEEEFQDHVYETVSALKRHKRLITDSLDRVVNAKETPLDTSAPPRDLARLWDQSRLDGNFSLSELERSLNEVLEPVKQCVEKANAILEAASAWENTEKTGGLAIRIVLLNSGDTDGLIQPDGTLVVDGVTGDIYIEPS